MITHLANPSFWACYAQLPRAIQELADKNFDLLKTNPYHPSLHFKNVGKYWSVRVGKKIEPLPSKVQKGWCGFGSGHTPNMKG